MAVALSLGGLGGAPPYTQGMARAVALVLESRTSAGRHKEQTRMGQINVNPPPPRDGGDRSAAAGINMVTVLIALVVLLVLVWLFLAGPLSGVFRGGNTTNVNVTTPTQQPAVPAQPQPSPGSKP